MEAVVSWGLLPRACGQQEPRSPRAINSDAAIRFTIFDAVRPTDSSRRYEPLVMYS